jgi:hypothetical protein
MFTAMNLAYYSQLAMNTKETEISGALSLCPFVWMWILVGAGTLQLFQCGYPSIQLVSTLTSNDGCLQLHQALQ